MIDRKKLFTDVPEEIIVDIIDMFLSEYNERFFRELRKNIEEKDFVNFEKHVHKLKGAIVVFQDPVTTALAKELLEMATVIVAFYDPVTTALSKKVDEITEKKLEAGLPQVYEDLKKKTLQFVEELKIIRKEFSA